MPLEAAPGHARRPLDEVALARVVRRMRAAAAVPWLHGEVARRMGERLSVVRLQPARVLGWGLAVGGGREVLRAAYPKAEVVGVEPPPLAAPAVPTPWPWPWPWPRRGAREQPIAADAVAPGSAALVWANMVLHGCADPQAVMRQWQQAMSVDGFLMFSTLGPGSLQGLRDLYREQGWPAPHAPFVDMHDLGDMLLEAGFADPVMDQETVTLTWASPDALLHELRGLGGNVATTRWPALRTPAWRRRLVQVLADRAGADGRVALDFEIVYGHAFRPAPRPRLAAETVVPLDDLRAMARAARRKP